MAGHTVTASVEIGNLCSATCRRTGSESGPIAVRPNPIAEEEEYTAGANAPNDEVKAQVDAFFLKLNAQPQARGVIINYGTPAQIKKREGQIMLGVNIKKYDRTRFKFVNGGPGTGVRTRFIIVPPGAEEPQP